MSKPGQCVICHHSRSHGHYEGHRCGERDRHGYACLCDKTDRWARVLGLRDANGVGIRVGDVVTVPGRPGAALVLETARKRVTVEWDEGSGRAGRHEKVPASSLTVMSLDCSYAKSTWDYGATDHSGGSLGEGIFLYCDTHRHPAGWVVYETPEIAFHGPCHAYMYFDRLSFEGLNEPFDKTVKAR